MIPIPWGIPAWALRFCAFTATERKASTLEFPVSPIATELLLNLLNHSDK